MREVSPGDVIFSFRDTKICAVGFARSNAYEAPKPLEFGTVGAYWNKIGWRVDVRFVELRNSIRPIDHIDRLRAYLPERYSPLRPNGHGLQNIYLTQIGVLLAEQLVDLIGTEARSALQAWQVEAPGELVVLSGQAIWEEHQINEVKADPKMLQTDKEAVVLARRGQGLFRARVAQIERRCRITGVTDPTYLRASHTKPWRDASNHERLDGENGLLLTPDADLLFDRGFISFEDNGDVLVSPVVDLPSVERMGITSAMLRNVGGFSEGQRAYLAFHRKELFLKAKVTLTK